MVKSYWSDNFFRIHAHNETIQPTAGPLERSEFGQNPSTKLNTGNIGKYLCLPGALYRRQDRDTVKVLGMHTGIQLSLPTEGLQRVIPMWHVSDEQERTTWRRYKMGNSQCNGSEMRKNKGKLAVTGICGQGWEGQVEKPVKAGQYKL